MIVCLAIIGPANNPLHISSLFSEEESLKFHYILHCALDVFEERIAVRGKGTASIEPNLGLLYPTEDYQVYGYSTATRVKFLAIVEEMDEKTKIDDVVRDVFKHLHLAYIDAVSNPFHQHGYAIAVPTFDTKIKSLLIDSRK
mmetsp:Transcript_5459/g.7381  ORF Transcript_5459/g.7381 Transcript_5459/m.7381 type:complete len:142 (+) Transcript_5459:311-736(+)|eukprot:CAMPEP_0196579284 /NCGR_PEP_ID=MMETSP1081-20130531/19836_1 /TAXON_ID=36882 /ORGANISM="Pyramimonas amylifera, Strain CCMP720" /LENGTH=141 /DNA_ID=CAMNT_0041898817 /DNA_START=303 /DNA_END=728 /DNA_ORIENTATION=+